MSVRSRTGISSVGLLGRGNLALQALEISIAAPLSLFPPLFIASKTQSSQVLGEHATNRNATVERMQ